jgi:branched-chain amino acid transport system substrate-binding protein
MRGKTAYWGLGLLVLIAVIAVLCGSWEITPNRAGAAAKEIKIAVVYPLSGALARNGNLMVQGAKAAIGWVNDNGGIKSLGGAKLVPVVADTGSTVEGAASATERVCRDSEIAMVMGCWASSLTMSATEITERLNIPQFTISYSDQLTARGFKWGFYVVPPSSAQGELGVANVIGLARSAGQVIKTAMLVGDNQASSKGYYDAVRKLFPGMGIKIIGEEVWAMGALTDATPVMQKVKMTKPDIVAFMATAISEAQMCLMKKKELGITTPFVCNGGWAADPSFQQVGAQVLEGMIIITPLFPNKLTPQDWITRSLNQAAKEYAKEPYVGQELGYPWGMIPIMAEVLEKAGSTDRKKIWEAARKIELINVPATRYCPKQAISFDETGRIAKKYQGVMLVQWQNGVPQTVFPEELAVAKPKWVVN